MPRELVIVSERPIEVADQVLAAVAVDPALGIRTVFDGGGTQITDAAGETILTVLRTDGVDVLSVAEALLESPLAPGEVFWTEAYLPLTAGAQAGLEVAAYLADAVAGRIIVRGETYDAVEH
ncbi:hypothetical protein [Compostimonas suwonensis]|uniref:Uncharacterized protein n=1 Tax=Compostimonas suwonensis TaxID=1048394 RepID=A0A2M9C5F2_9MICO|nr:hypothetical protein [Compostimonas suwonensis]PJJ65707.1 hypothetical protein CLV54_0744 [Compostimonas suwonensis]